jgi:hypothetical protein
MVVMLFAVAPDLTVLLGIVDEVPPFSRATV